MARLAYLGVLVLFLLAAQVALAGNLYPKCAGATHTKFVPWTSDSRPQQLYSFPWTSASMSLNCLGFEVVTKSSSLTGCDQATLDRDKPYRIYLQATTVTEGSGDSAGSNVKHQWEVDDTVGGSVEKLLYSVPSSWNQVTSWTLWVQNQSPNKGCNMEAHVIAQTTGTDVTSEKQDATAPGLTLISPTTVYEGKKTLLGFKVIGGPHSSDAVRVRDLFAESSSDREWATLSRVTKSSVLSEYGLTGDEAAAFEHDFPEAGNYQLEYKRNGHWTTVAHVVVYGGNPAFFTITAGAGPDGQIFINRATEITFHGHELNSHNNADAAKFVDTGKYKCTADAPAAAGVSQATDLRPGNRKHLSMTHWSFTMTVGGMYRVCYKRKGKKWAEIASRDDLPDMGPSTEIPQGQIPVPTNAEGQPCKLAPGRHDQPSYDTALRMTLNTDVMPASFRANLASVLCVTTNDIVLLDIHHTVTSSGKRRLQVDMDVVCNSYGRSDLCLGTERKNYALWLWNTYTQVSTLKNVGIEKLEEIPASGVYVYEKPGGGGSGHPVLAAFLVLLAIGGVGAAMYFYVQKNGMPTTNRFMPIGHGGDEADDDDDDENAPTNGAKSKDTTRV